MALPGPLFDPQEWSQTLFIRELHPQSPAPQMQERSRVSTFFLGICVTQHRPHSLTWHMVPPGSIPLPGLMEAEQCHHTGDMWVPTVPCVTSGHLKGDHSIPFSAIKHKDPLAAPSPSDEYLGCSCHSFLAGGVG